jgi:hypothetical protein
VASDRRLCDSHPVNEVQQVANRAAQPVAVVLETPKSGIAGGTQKATKLAIHVAMVKRQLLNIVTTDVTLTRAAVSIKLLGG